MSIRAANTNTSTSAPTVHFKSDDRLKAVLAAGVREIGAPLAPPTPRIPAQPGGLREREPPDAARLLDALDNERDLRRLVLSPESGLPCEALEKLADASEKYNTNQFWYEQCKVRGYMHPYFLTPSDGQPWDKQDHTWREHFVHWCANVNAADYDDWTALMRASREGHLAVVQALLGAGAPVNVAMNDGWTALTWASLSGHTGIVQALIDAGANVDAAGKTGNTALIKASHEGHLDTVQALLNAGANVNRVAKHGYTALIFATIEGHLAVVQTLLAAGANVNAASDVNGWTALRYASRNDDLLILQALRDAGAE